MIVRKSRCRWSGSRDVTVAPTLAPLCVGIGDVPRGLDEDGLKGMERDAVVGPVAARVHVVVASPVPLVTPGRGMPYPVQP